MTFDGNNVGSAQIATVGVKKETTFGTFAGSPRWLGVVKIYRPRRIPNLEVIGGIRDSRRGIGMVELGYQYECVIEGELQNLMPLYMALGKIDTSGAVPPYTHSVNMIRGETGGIENYLPSFSLHAQILNWDGAAADEMIGLNGATVSSLNLNIPLAGLARYTLNLIAKDIQTTSITSPTEATDAQFGSYNTDLEIDNDSAVFDSGDSVKGLNSLDITMDNSLDVSGEFNSTTIRRPYMGDLRNSISAKIDRKYIDVDLTTLADGTPFSFQSKFVRNAASDYIHLKGEYCYAGPVERNIDLANAIANTPLDVHLQKLSVSAKDGTADYE